MEKSLIIQAARFGDMVQTRRLVESAGRDGEVWIAGDTGLRDLAETLYPGAKFKGVHFHGAPDWKRARENLEVFGELAEQKFSKIYNCNFSALTTALCRLFPDNEIVNYRPARDSEGGTLRSGWSRLVFRLSKFRNSAPLNIVDYWGWIIPDPIEGEKINPPATPGGRGLGVVLAGREARRSLPMEIYGQIINIVLSAKKPREIRLFGTDNETRLARELYKTINPRFRDSVIDLTGKTGWKELYSELTGLDLLLSPDTGTAHLAASLGVPVMAFFLSSALCHETGPYGEGHMVWQAFGDCSPCLESAKCPRDTKCVRPFASREFFRCLTEWLQEKRLKSPPPEGLVLYDTEFDSLGIRFRKAAGIDPWERRRNYARRLVKNWLKLPTPVENEAKEILEFKEYIEDIFPEDEWIFPSKRYA